MKKTSKQPDAPAPSIIIWMNGLFFRPGGQLREMIIQSYQLLKEREIKSTTTTPTPRPRPAARKGGSSWK